MDGSDASIQGIAPVVGLDLTGTWHLADCTLTYANGKVQRPWAHSATGYLIYAPNGHMCLSLNYPNPDGRIGCVSYCGEYRIWEDHVFHEISVSADIRDVGTTVDHTVGLEHGRLTLSVSPAPAGGPGSVMDYIWNRAEAAHADALSTPRAQDENRFNSGR